MFIEDFKEINIGFSFCIDYHQSEGEKGSLILGDPYSSLWLRNYIGPIQASFFMQAR
jgi:hypothetical protein